MAGIMRWEYTKVWLTIGDARGQARDHDEWFADINRLGADGWEAVGSVTVGSAYTASPYLLFKRPIS